MEEQEQDMTWVACLGCPVDRLQSQFRRGSSPLVVRPACRSTRFLARLRAGVDGGAQQHSMWHCHSAEGKAGRQP